jgi:hypothetical protein
MTTSGLLRTYAVSLASFLMLDFVWLGLLARGFYRDQLSSLLAPERSDEPRYDARLSGFRRSSGYGLGRCADSIGCDSRLSRRLSRCAVGLALIGCHWAPATVLGQESDPPSRLIVELEGGSVRGTDCGSSPHRCRLRGQVSFPRPWISTVFDQAACGRDRTRAGRGVSLVLQYGVRTAALRGCRLEAISALGPHSRRRWRGRLPGTSVRRVTQAVSRSLRPLVRLARVPDA